MVVLVRTLIVPGLLSLSAFAAVSGSTLAVDAVLASGVAVGPTAADSGWVSLYNGKDFSGLNYFLSAKGFSDVKAQTNFKTDSGFIHADGPYSLLVTAKEYSSYRARVDYRFAPDVGDKANAGMMILFDTEAAKTHTVGLRPRSIEINFRRDGNFPGTLWAAQGYGPYITTTVKAGSQDFLPRPQGGVGWICEPWDPERRVVHSSLPVGENPPGQWNRLQAEVYGDSAAIRLNGNLRTSGWHFQVRGSPDDSTPAKRVAVAAGGLAIQAEGFELWYRAWEIQELDPVTRIPLHARRGCTDPLRAGYDARAVVEDGSCAGIGVREVTRKVRQRGAPSGTARAVYAAPGGGARDAGGRAVMPVAASE